MSADDLKKPVFQPAAPETLCMQRGNRIPGSQRSACSGADEEVVEETQNTDAVNVFISTSFSQAVMSRARSAMGRASGTVRHVQTPPLCSETGSASASAAHVSTVRPESATVKTTLSSHFAL